MSEVLEASTAIEDLVSSGPPVEVQADGAGAINNNGNNNDDPPEIGPDEKLWDPDGPTKAMIDEWKATYGDVYVTSVTPERHYVWRTLRRSEYRELVQRLEKQIADGVSSAVANMNNEESASEICILYPKYSHIDPSNMAGVASVIAQEIMEASGFVASDVRIL
jgi:hypothetical protein